MRTAAAPSARGMVLTVYRQERSVRATAAVLGVSRAYVKAVVETAMPGLVRPGGRRVVVAYGVEIGKRCLRHASSEMGGVLTRAEYDAFASKREEKEGQRWPRSRRISLAFGGWALALTAAGLEAGGVKGGQGRAYGREQCLDFGREVTRALGHLPTGREYQGYRSGPGCGMASSRTIGEQFGSWPEFLVELEGDQSRDAGDGRLCLTPIPRPELLEALLATRTNGTRAQGMAKCHLERAVRVLGNGRYTALDYPWETLRAEDLEALERRLLLAGAFQGDVVRVLKAMARVACRAGLLDDAEAERIRVVSVHGPVLAELPPLPQGLTGAVAAIRASGAYGWPLRPQAQGVSLSVREARDRAIFELVTGGLRAEEVIALDVCDWNPELRCLQVTSGPLRRHRAVRLTGRACRALDAWISGGTVGTGPLFAKPMQGGRLGVQLVSYGVARLCSHAGVESVALSDLWRWGLQQMLIEGRSDDEIIQEVGLHDVEQLRRLTERAEAGESARDENAA